MTPAATIPDATPSEPGAVLAQFESLGDSCEFAFAQQQFAVAPISLLRWTGAPLAGLILALQRQFAGLYRRADLIVHDHGMVLDAKYDLRFHGGPYPRPVPFVPGPIPPDAASTALHAAETRRVGFELRQTLANLAERRKIFIYKTSAGLSQMEILQLKAALDLYGPQRLLCVLPAGPEIAVGDVRCIATGVKIGGIAQFAPYQRQEAADGAAWAGLCRAALSGAWGDEAVSPPRPNLQTQPDRPQPVFEPTAHGVAVHNPDLARGVVTALYGTLLLRPPDAGGLHDHAACLAERGMAVEEVIAAFLRSGEFAHGVGTFLSHYGVQPADHAPRTATDGSPAA